MRTPADGLDEKLLAEIRALHRTKSAQIRALSQAENQEAIAAHNQFVERNGLWSDGLRQF